MLVTHVCTHIYLPHVHTYHPQTSPESILQLSEFSLQSCHLEQYHNFCHVGLAEALRVKDSNALRLLAGSKVYNVVTTEFLWEKA